MDGKKEWFTLQETAELLECKGPDGRLLSGHEAEQAVLELVFDGGDGERFPLIPSVLFASPVLVKRYLSKIWRSEGSGCVCLGYRVRIKGLWPWADKGKGFPFKRFGYVVPPCPYWRHPFEVAITATEPVEFMGLLHLWLYGQLRRVDGKVLLDKSGIEPKRKFPSAEILWHDPAFCEYPNVQVVAFEKVTVDGIEHRPICKTINENELIVTRASLANYAADHGYVETLKLLAGGPDKEQTAGLNIVDVPVKSLVVPLAPPAAEVEQVGLLLPNAEERIKHLKELAQQTLADGKNRMDTARVLKQKGATLEQIGMILTDDGSKNRSRDAWEKRAIRLLKGELKGFV